MLPDYFYKPVKELTSYEKYLRYGKVQYKRDKQRGICMRCRGPVDKKNATQCKACCNKRNSFARENYSYYKESNLCTHCQRRDAIDGTVRCSHCKVEANKHYKKRYAKRKKQGICTNCKVKIDPIETTSKIRCKKCLDILNEYKKMKRKEWKEDYLCSKCGGEIEYHRSGKRTCQKCIDKERALRSNRQKKNQVIKEIDR